MIDIRRAVGPMVGQSDAPFRSLCLKYGATVAYTEMLYSSEIVECEEYLDRRLPSVDHMLQNLGYKSRPLVAQICGHDPVILARACGIIADSKRVDAVDLNLGCPQDRAREGLFGSYLLDKCHWNTVFTCVREMASALEARGLPLFCKIRLIEGSDVLELTKEFCR
jgi:tRNA-dihydrouridine synthase 1